MGFLSSILGGGGGMNPLGGLLGGGGGSSGGGVSSGGIGSKTGNVDNAGNTTTTDTTNVDKRQVINSGGVGVATDSSPITISNNSSDPQNYAALLAVTDHLAMGALAMTAANMDYVTQASQAPLASTSTTKKAASSLIDYYNAHKIPVLAGVALVAYLVLRKG
ncbi:hypothetical protein [Dechloromonas sp. HYN0024]|uniref:hypothetical protein n=1 Tax=Dechloromonas sp. HYN0024 TaxID=2231055 RepID=UPI000E433EC2|nr:hypothetical protein [Dechloromonas sp. HYN0024]AXS79859.1 hypothetical protein HYN24_07415 [Dechloromonas sp. HYN0024]